MFVDSITSVLYQYNSVEYHLFVDLCTI